MPSPSQPYVGPRPFDAADAHEFLGREQELGELTDLVTNHSAVLLYSPPGMGKTSLLHAGLIPRLRRQDFAVLPVVRFRGTFPPSAVTQSVANPYVYETVATWLDTDRDVPLLPTLSLANGLRRRREAGAVPLGGVPCLLSFDQFEEFFAVYPEQRALRKAFFEEIADLLRSDPLVHILFALREDAIGNIERYAPLFPDRLQARYYLTGLTREAALQAVVQPLAGTGRSFAPGAAEHLVDDLLTERVVGADGQERTIASEFVDPVQLQIVCQRLWQALPPSVSHISLLDRTVDNADRALAAFYDDSIREAAQAGGIAEARLRRWCEDTLITSSGERALVSRNTQATVEIPLTALNGLVDRHLLRREDRSATSWYELAHDRLVDIVRSDNAAWFAENVPILERQAQLWQRSGQPEDLLLRGEACANAEQWAAEHVSEMTPLARAFVTASRQSDASMAGRVAALVAKTSDRATSVRRTAFQDLAQIDDRRAIDALILHLQDDDVQVRTAAALALKQRVMTAAVPGGSASPKDVKAEEAAVQRPLKVFLCHSSGDKPVVRLLYERLCANGIRAWINDEDLLPGQHWREEIPRAVRKADVVLVCLSQGSIAKTGYVQKEIKIALDVADEQPEGVIFLIPVRLESCVVPARLGETQWVDLFNEDGFDRLMRALHIRATELGAQINLQSNAMDEERVSYASS